MLLENDCTIESTPSVKVSIYYKDVLDLHAKFHKEAGTVLELAVKYDKSQENELVTLAGDFSKYSGALTAKMKEWQKAL